LIDIYILNLKLMLTNKLFLESRY